MLDAKAELDNGNRTATIQMSQTSMHVRQKRAGAELDVPGKLETMIQRGSRTYRVVTIIAKFVYEEGGTHRKLQRIIVACIPSGDLQDTYNPTAKDTIWLAGRNAPTLGEEFRVRLNYAKLSSKAAWRVQRITEPQPIN